MISVGAIHRWASDPYSLAAMGRAPITSAPRDGRAIPCVVTIAGSDSGGGAGIQADLKAFAACGVHGMTAITAITAQNTVAVTAVEQVSPAMILAQVRAVATDIGIDAVKIGMVSTVEAIEAVAAALDELDDNTPVVLDPVMVAESGAVLVPTEARSALLELLIPRATVITPNLPEAKVLVGSVDEVDLDELVRELFALGPACAVLTGGHAEDLVDRFYDGEEVVIIGGERFAAGAAHGSGCTHASALAAHLALGATPLEAARQAKVIASYAVRDGIRSVGEGSGPVNVLGIGRDFQGQKPTPLA